MVEEAVSDLGMRTLVDGYFRTGREWRAKVGAGGRVWWVPVTGGERTAGASPQGRAGEPDG